MYIETTYVMTDEVMDLFAEAEKETGYDYKFIEQQNTSQAILQDLHT
jgi:hypothetical protein